MWVLARRHTSAADNICVRTSRSEGELDTASCGPRWSDVLERHEGAPHRPPGDRRTSGPGVESAASYPRSSTAPNGCADRLQELAARPSLDITSTAPCAWPVYRTGTRPTLWPSSRTTRVLDGLSVVAGCTDDLTEAFEARRRGTEPGWSPVRMRYNRLRAVAAGVARRFVGAGKAAPRGSCVLDRASRDGPQVLELPSDRSRSGEYGSAAAGR
ncbi:hypothetical protein GS934_14045 [Rhodococcus hoagii]|nr:hypothetical protein [Prescottella equi]NKZ87968.1 hypothetical protein [Prescottella equi]